ncbi:DedA family protein [Acaricomes phytoseiuli]|uniref:DedA family protein n=1 Tax=Acaricomes phytoseiuli TaxID=291968 RepID=UPI0003A3B44F|nr:DedA family protein [Acaricomes phytoseiuli]
MDLLDFIRGLSDSLNGLIAHSASQWWVVPVVGLFSMIDGFFMFVPSESLIVALSAVSANNGGVPNLWYLMAVTAVGATIGDNIAYFLGRKIGTAGFGWMRQPKVEKTMQWARRELDKRGAVLILTARYIPVGRVAVNFTAGATQYPWRRFVWVDILACISWAAYSVAIGNFAGRWIENNELLGVLLAIVLAVIMGFIVDHLIRFFHNWLDRKNPKSVNPEIIAEEIEAEEAATARSEDSDDSDNFGDPASRRVSS